MESQYLSNIKKDMKVTILTNQNRYSTGFVEEIGSRTEFHVEGIMVRLKNGDIGRVKKIILNEPEQSEKLSLEIRKLIDNGENINTEFKAEAFWSIVYNPIQLKESKSLELREYGQKASKVIIAKSIASFLNSEGGNLLIGVKEDKEKDKLEITGIESDMKRIRDQNTDGYKRTIIDEIIRAFFPSKIFNHLNDYIKIEFAKIEDKTICWIKIRKSDSRVFLSINNKEIFMIRVDSENRTLNGEKLVDYCIKKWGAR